MICREFFNIYCPRRSWSKVIFSQASVILFTGGGVCLSACWDITPDKADPLARRPPWQGDPLARRPPGKADHPPQQGDTPWQGGPPWQGRAPPCRADPPPPGRADPLARQTPPAQCMMGDTVNKRAVCILLECNSCYNSFLKFQLSHLAK